MFVYIYLSILCLLLLFVFILLIALIKSEFEKRKYESNFKGHSLKKILEHDGDYLVIPNVGAIMVDAHKSLYRDLKNNRYKGLSRKLKEKKEKK